MLEGLLRFAPDLAALIRYDEENKQTDKAVYIDAEGNETPICGGGSGDIDVYTVTVTASGSAGQFYEITRSYYDGVDKALIPQQTESINFMIAYEDEITMFANNGAFVFSNVTGDAELDELTGDIKITGDCAFSVAAGLS